MPSLIKDCITMHGFFGFFFSSYHAVEIYDGRNIREIDEIDRNRKNIS